MLRIFLPSFKILVAHDDGFREALEERGSEELNPVKQSSKVIGEGPKNGEASGDGRSNGINEDKSENA